MVKEIVVMTAASVVAGVITALVMRTYFGEGTGKTGAISDIR